MKIKEGDIEIGGSVEVVSASLEVYETVINKQPSFYTKLNLKLKISCEIEGIDIEPFYTERLFQLSNTDFDKLKEKGIIEI
jgi:hypothetical protein